MNWTSIRILLPERTQEDWKDTQLALNNIGYTMRPNRHKSSLWGRIQQGDIEWYHKTITWGDESYYYELLVPGLKERQVTILEDLGYKVKTNTMSKSTRRCYFRKVDKDEYFKV